MEAEKREGMVGGGWDNAVEAASMDTTGRFISPDETAVATIGSNYIQNYLSGGEVSRGVGILTQKRFYYKGKNFSGNGREVQSATEEGIVSIEDITFTKFTHFRHTGYLVVGLFFLLLSLVCFLVGNLFVTIGGVLIVPALALLITYFVKRESLFLVAFPGGGFSFDIRWYPIADIRDFQNQLHLLKDHIKEGGK